MGGPNFWSSGAATATIVNESSYALELGWIQAGETESIPWSVDVLPEGSTYWTPEFNSPTVDAQSLDVQSAGDILVRDRIYLPGVDVNLTSDGDLQMSPSQFTTPLITALNVALVAGGSIGTYSPRLQPELEPPDSAEGELADGGDTSGGENVLT